MHLEKAYRASRSSSDRLLRRHLRVRVRMAAPRSWRVASTSGALRAAVEVKPVIGVFTEPSRVYSHKSVTTGVVPSRAVMTRVDFAGAVSVAAVSSTRASRSARAREEVRGHQPTRLHRRLRQRRPLRSRPPLQRSLHRPIEHRPIERRQTERRQSVWAPRQSSRRATGGLRTLRVTRRRHHRPQRYLALHRSPNRTPRRTPRRLNDCQCRNQR